MIVRVLLFARYQEAAGSPELRIDLPDGVTLGGVWEEVQRRVPSLREESAPLMAIDRAYARAATLVPADGEVAFFPPVSGG
jgi:molybdopterin converting factor subunit 1